MGGKVIIKMVAVFITSGFVMFAFKYNVNSLFMYMHLKIKTKGLISPLEKHLNR